MITFFWGVPIGYLVQFSNLYTLSKVPGIGKIADVILREWPPGVASFLVQYLPTLVLLLFVILVTPILKLFSRLERPMLKTDAQYTVMRRYYTFLVFNTIFLSAISSQIITLTSEFVTKPDEVPITILERIGTTFPGYGAFYLDYVFNSGMTTSVISLLRIWEYLCCKIMLFFATTQFQKEKVKKWWSIAFEYCSWYPMHLNIVGSSGINAEYGRFRHMESFEDIDPIDPIANVTTYSFPNIVPTEGIVVVFLFNIVIFICGLAVFIFWRKYDKEFFFPQGTEADLNSSSVEFSDQTESKKESSLLLTGSGHPYGTMENRIGYLRGVRGWLDWGLSLWNFDEEKVFHTCGLDAVMYLVFMKTCTGIFLVASMVGLVVLIPLNVYGNKDAINPINNGTIAGFLATCLANDTQTLWFNLLVLYFITAVVLLLTLLAFFQFLSWRKIHKKLPLPSNYSVLVTNLPERIKTSEDLKNTFHQLWPNFDIVSASLFYDLHLLDAKLKEREGAKVELDVARHKFYLNFQRPVHRTGFLGLFGPEVDSLDYHTKKIHDANEQMALFVRQLKQEGFTGLKSLGMGIITFRTLR
eukprot:TRINITY_DN7917_c0_g2_i10.p1 TRINITY_DN7917_c0_g2~~TRINITY_DN7917_c0_g2_i10.p1  ORF type:complete len:584 (+),score=100.12 TRINITY_DN7917_c0_g2_i10:388-2139(+)